MEKCQIAGLIRDTKIYIGERLELNVINFEKLPLMKLVN